MKPRPKALIIETDPAIRRLVRIILENENYRVLETADGESGSRLAMERKPDVVILDFGMTDINPTDWLQSFREWNQTPVLVLSVQGQPADKVAALDAGANDILGTPFDTGELLARLRVLQRCVPGIPEGPFLIEGGLKVNLATHEVTLYGRRIRFTTTEEALFYLLVRHVGKVVTCEHLACSVWGSDAENKLHELQVLMSRIRRKLEAERERVMIRTEGRIGYQLILASSQPVNAVAELSKTLDVALP